MTKLDFLYELREALSELPREDIERYVDYYSEMIADRIDDGMSEEEAVDAIGTVEDIASKILGDMPQKPGAAEPERPKDAPKRENKLSGLAILLIILGFPIWFPLLMSAFAVLLSIIVSLFSVIISLWAVEVSLWGCTLGGLIAGCASAVCGRLPAGLAMCGVALFSAGLSVFMLYACKALTKWAVRITAKSFLAFFGLFKRKEGRI